MREHSGLNSRELVRRAPALFTAVRARPWVNISHSETLTALNGTLGRPAVRSRVEETLTLAEVTSGHREVTTILASWIMTSSLVTGRIPAYTYALERHGIRSR